MMIDSNTSFVVVFTREDKKIYNHNHNHNLCVIYDTDDVLAYPMVIEKIKRMRQRQIW